MYDAILRTRFLKYNIKFTLAIEVTMMMSSTTTSSILRRYLLRCNLYDLIISIIEHPFTFISTF